MVSSSHSMKIDPVHRWACICTTTLVCVFKTSLLYSPFTFLQLKLAIKSSIVSHVCLVWSYFFPVIFPRANPFFWLGSHHSFGKKMLEQSFPLAPCTDNPFQFLFAEISQLPDMPMWNPFEDWLFPLHNLLISSRLYVLKWFDFFSSLVFSLLLNLDSLIEITCP